MTRTSRCQRFFICLVLLLTTPAVLAAIFLAGFSHREAGEAVNAARGPAKKLLASASGVTPLPDRA